MGRLGPRLHRRSSRRGKVQRPKGSGRQRRQKKPSRAGSRYEIPKTNYRGYNRTKEEEQEEEEQKWNGAGVTRRVVLRKRRSR